MKTLLVFLLTSCSTLYNRGPTSTLLLRPRHGHQDKLTHQICTKKTWLGKCTSYDTKEFDLNDDAVRKLLRDLKFVCKVQGERFMVCEKSRGICNLRLEKPNWFSHPVPVVHKYFSMHDDYDLLIAANMHCCVYDTACGRAMFE